MSGMTTGVVVYDPARRDQVQAFVPGPQDYFALPAGITKAAAMAVIAAGLRLMGASEREIAVWHHIADTTERAAWSAADRAPLNWRRQCDMAREMGLGERHWRNIERALVRYGVLARATAENGYRGYREGSRFARPLRAGLSLEPALANYPALVMRLAEAGGAEAQRQEYILHAAHGAPSSGPAGGGSGGPGAAPLGAKGFGHTGGRSAPGGAAQRRGGGAGGLARRAARPGGPAARGSATACL